MMRRNVIVGVLAAVSLAAAGCTATTPRTVEPPVTSNSSSAVEAPAAAAAVPTVLVVDGSGSMNEPDAPGPRIDAAKRAVSTLVDSLPDGAPVGLMTYGTGTGSEPSEQSAGCHDVRTVLPVAAVDRLAFRDRVAELTPRGYTPIGNALIQAVAQLPTDTPSAVVLISDGEDTCTPPAPCDVARQIHDSHPRLAISTVGFKTSSEQLSCVAAATGGLYIGADNASQLTARLLATQDTGAARTSLTGQGLGDIAVGELAPDVVAAHPDFPALASGANAGDRVVVVWHDCDWSFDTGNRLVEIRPHAGRTIDGLGIGDALSSAVQLYGPPVTTTADPDGTHEDSYPADAAAGNGYAITYTGAGAAATITAIALCHCLPPPQAPAPSASSTPVPASGRWTDRELTIAPNGLGAVRVGMSTGQAATAAGVPFDGSGDGFHYPTSLPAGYPHLYIGSVGGGCVGAQDVGAAGSSPLTVVTSAGLRLGDSVQQLQSIYGSAANFVPAPSGGPSPTEGYVVAEDGGALAFSIRGGRVTRIAGGSANITPSVCTG